MVGEIVPHAGGDVKGAGVQDVAPWCDERGSRAAIMATLSRAVQSLILDLVFGFNNGQ
jgi:hypothetical protein